MTIDLEKITAYMDELKDTKARLSFDLKAIEKEIEKVEVQLVSLLSETGVDEMQYGSYSFGLKTTIRTAFDQKLFSFEHPELFEKYKIPKEGVKFEFKISK